MTRPTVEREKVLDQDFESMNISVTSRIFINCTFTECNLFYAGGGVVFDGCRFGSGNRWILSGPIKETMIGKSPGAIVSEMKSEWKKIQDFLEAPPGVDGFGNIKT